MVLGAFGPWFLAGCSSVHVEVQDIEVTQRGLHFDPAPAMAPAGPIATTCSFQLDSSSASWTKQLDANVHATRVRLHAADGSPDLDFVEFAMVSISAPPSADAVTIMSYQAPSTATSVRDLETTNVPPIDVTRIWSSPQVRVDLTVAGQLPPMAWSADLTLGLSGEITWRP